MPIEDQVGPGTAMQNPQGKQLQDLRKHYRSSAAAEFKEPTKNCRSHMCVHVFSKAVDVWMPGNRNIMWGDGGMVGRLKMELDDVFE